MPTEPNAKNWHPWLLMGSIFIMIGSGIILELMIAGYSAHLNGDSIYQFSLTIGLFMSAMGIGSYLTQHIERDLIQRLHDLQLLTGLLGAGTILFLSLADLYTNSYHLLCHLWTGILGALIGFQLPLVIRIIERDWPVSRLLAQALLFDYVGALAGSLLLPWWLLPSLGFPNASLVVGAFCLLSVGLLWIGFSDRLRTPALRRWSTLAVAGLLLLGWNRSHQLVEHLAARQNPGIHLAYLARSPYQELRFVRHKKSYFLTLNRQPQFSTQDEQRYHEALVHPVMLSASSRRRVLLLGGGDGLALREIWKYHDVREVVMVDLDPLMTNFGQKHPLIRRFNKNSMKPQPTRSYCLTEQICPGQSTRLLYEQQLATAQSCALKAPGEAVPLGCRLQVRKVTVRQTLKIENRDAWKYIETHTRTFPVIISDLPDATNISLSKLYSLEFYRTLRRRLAKGGAMAVQSTAVSPYYRRGYWCIVNTIQRAGFHTHGYHVWVPSFGIHTGFTLATSEPTQPERLLLRTPTRYLNDQILPAFFWFPKDMSHIPTPINRIDTHVLLRFLLRG